MPHAGLSAAVSRAGRAALRSADDPPSDGRLLSAFITTRDPDAFTELVARHGPMVFAVCRRLTGHCHDAEDAFQAVFVVLAGKAAAVTPRDAVGNRLYGVAVRTAREARSVSARRRAREVPTDRLPDVARTGPEPDDLGAVLHEELAELPDKFRSLLVLCDLEGRTQTEVAARLGLPVGTIYSRLATARRLLAGRLRKRGVGLSAAVLTAALAQAGSATVPAGLSARAVASAASPGLVPASVAALSNGVAQRMFLTKLKALTPILGLGAVVLLAAGLPASPVAPAGNAGAYTHAPPKPVAKAADPKPPPAGPNKILLVRHNGLTLIDPTGMNERVVLPDDMAASPYRDAGRLSPDGKKVAFVAPDGTPNDPNPTAELRTAGVDDKEGQPLGVLSPRSFVWSADGSEIAFTEFPTDVKKLSAVHGVVNVRTKERAALKLPDDHYITDWSRDGKHFVTTRVWPNAGVFLVSRDGTEHKALTENRLPAGSYGLMGRLSPDSQRVLFTIVTPKKPGEAKSELAVLDCATGKVSPVADVPVNGEVLSYCWSPDGRQIAYLWGEVYEGKPEGAANKEVESQLVVCDADRKNARAVVSDKGQLLTIIGMDWR
jgi:RNA polymerase sigma factor (sigma-70 family)